MHHQPDYYDDSFRLAAATCGVPNVRYTRPTAQATEEESENLMLKLPNDRKISFKRKSIWEFDNDDNWVRRGSEIVMEEEGVEEVDEIDCSPCCRTEKFKSAFVALCLGQVLSLCLCGSGVASQLLYERFKINTPTTQSFCTYFFLSFVYGTVLSCRAPQSGLITIVRERGWKYLLVALCDVEANFLVVLAYQYTNLTSIQLLDCITIPVVLLLSWLLLRVRYRLLHIVGVAICLVGIGCLVLADTLTDRDGSSTAETPSTTNRFVGDMLCLGGASLYGVGNVAEEHFVKAHSRIEYLGMLGIFGSVISGLQLALLERNRIATVDWANFEIIGLFLLFTVSMFIFYSLVAVVIRRTSATLFNLSILTADFYTLLLGIFLFKFQFHTLYFGSFLLVALGSIIYSCKDTKQVEDDPSEVGTAASSRRFCCCRRKRRGRKDDESSFEDVREEEEDDRYGSVSFVAGGRRSMPRTTSPSVVTASLAGSSASTTKTLPASAPPSAPWTANAMELRYCPIHGPTTRPQRPKGDVAKTIDSTSPVPSSSRVF